MALVVNHVTKVDYIISTFESSNCAYQTKHGIKLGMPEAEITIYISTIWKRCNGDIDKFTRYLIYYTYLERICIERAFNKIRMRNRCNPCKLWTPCTDIIIPLIIEDFKF